MREKLIKKEDLTLENAVKICQADELTRKRTDDMQSYKTTAAIHSTRQVQKSVEWNGRRKQGWRDNRGGSRAVERNSDGNGGYRTNQQRSNTNQRRSNTNQQQSSDGNGAYCTNQRQCCRCGKPGHIKRFCPNRQVNEVQVLQEDNAVNEVQVQQDGDVRRSDDVYADVPFQIDAVSEST